MGLPSGLRKRGTTYYVQYRHGKVWRLKAVGTDLATAVDEHKRLRLGIKPRKPPGRPRFEPKDLARSPKLEQLVERWLRSQETRCKPSSILHSTQRARGLLRYFKNWPADLITGEALDDYIRWRREQKVGDTTINGDLTTLRQILRYAYYEARILPREPTRVKMLRTLRKQRRKILERGDIQKLLETAQQMGKIKVEAFIRIAATTGMRKDEILHLRWSDISFEDHRIDITAKEWVEKRFDRDIRKYVEREMKWSPKSHQERSVWVDGEALFDWLRVYRSRQVANGEIDWVFQGVKPGLRFTAIDHRLRTVFEWAGVYERGRLAHTFRHAVATHLLENGVDLETVRDWLGHQQVTTTALYLHATDDRKRKAAAKLRLI